MPPLYALSYFILWVFISLLFLCKEVFVISVSSQIDLYLEKTDYLEQYFERVSAFTFYRDIFPLGSFERTGHYEDKKPNGIVLEIMNDGKTKRSTVTDDLSELCAVHRENFTIVSPISYYGYRRTGVNARYLYAMAFDLDGVKMQNLRDVIHQMNREVIPKATYICNSGNGLHLYYVFKKPIPLFPHNQMYLKAIKYALTKRIWNGYTSTIEKPQMQGILQGFRVVGTPTKFGKDYSVTAFSVGDKWDLQKLIDFVPDIYESGLNEINALEKKSKLSLDEAKKKYPEWYERRVVRGERKGRWHVNRALYDWWLDRIKREITVGHRYYAIMTLAIYAKKCNIHEDELRQDAFSLLRLYENMTYEEDNHFEEQHIIDALELFNEDYVTFPRDDIAKLTGLNMTKNKRNGRKQEIHLKIARATQEAICSAENINWREGNGRPKGSGTKEYVVREYQQKYPDATKADVIRGTGLSKPTVYKYYKK